MLMADRSDPGSGGGGGGVAPPSRTPTSANTGIMPPPATSGPVWPPVPAALQPTATPVQAPTQPNLLAGLTTQPSATSPTGGTVGLTNAQEVASVGQGVDTSAKGLLPSTFTTANLGVPAANATPPPAQGYINQASADMQAPTQWNITSDQTVAGQYAKLMQPGNLAIQDAEQSTLRAYAAAGGGNNLMAQNAATLAGSKVALTMAAQDAATYAAAGQYNATAANAFKQQLNDFTDNALLSRQNFDQGVAMLGAQTNQQLTLLAANVNATAATSSIQLKEALAQTKINLGATMATMDKQFTQAVDLADVNANIASQQSWQQYGQQIRLGYLSAISQQQASLQNTIAAIQSNPNITQTQATGAVTDAINEFNTFVAQLGAYSSALVPKQNGTGTYNSPAYAYNYLPPGFPNTK